VRALDLMGARQGALSNGEVNFILVGGGHLPHLGLYWRHSFVLLHFFGVGAFFSATFGERKFGVAVLLWFKNVLTGP